LHAENGHYGPKSAQKRQRLQRLVDKNILAQLEGIHPKTYFSPEIFKIAYGDATFGEE
jgi:hypothetical protein